MPGSSTSMDKLLQLLRCVLHLGRPASTCGLPATAVPIERTSWPAGRRPDHQAISGGSYDDGARRADRARVRRLRAAAGAVCMICGMTADGAYSHHVRYGRLRLDRLHGDARHLPQRFAICARGCHHAHADRDGRDVARECGGVGALLEIAIGLGANKTVRSWSSFWARRAASSNGTFSGPVPRAVPPWASRQPGGLAGSVCFSAMPISIRSATSRAVGAAATSSIQTPRSLV